MSVCEYEPRTSVVLHAALWEGNVTDLAGFPDFNSLVEMIIRVDGKGLLILDMTSQNGEEEVYLEPGRHYLVRGITGKFWVMERKEFEQTYQLVTIVLKGKRG